MDSSVPKDSGNSRKRERNDLVLSVRAETWTLHVSTSTE